LIFIEKVEEGFQQSEEGRVVSNDDVKLMIDKWSKISTMANFKKMDDHDFVFVNKPLTAKEEKEFSDYLKSRKSKIKTKRNSRTAVGPKIELASRSAPGSLFSLSFFALTSDRSG